MESPTTSDEQLPLRIGGADRKTLDKHAVPFSTMEKFDYVTKSKYTPDFFLPNGVILEAKGFFKPPIGGRCWP